VQNKIRQTMKLVFTVLAVVWGFIFFTVAYVVERLFIDSQVYIDYMDFIILPNFTNVLHVINAFAYDTLIY